ncbi:MAG: DNA replication/repair protein RecF [Dehalococcoidia bacterium]
MHLTHLSLTNFRNYARLELDLRPGASIFVGENAQGKTNLLEAVYLLATTRSPRTGNDTDFVRWAALDDGLSATRVIGRAARRRDEVQVEVAVLARPQGNGAMAEAPRGGKRLRVNGLPRRATDVIGQVLAVLFTSQDIDLLTGPPAGRRRYLDITLAQVDHAYLRALQRYQRVTQQRNVLLRRVAEGRAAAAQLASWNEELVAQGAAVTAMRAAAITELSRVAAEVHHALSERRERLDIVYAPQVAEEGGDGALDAVEAVRDRYRAALERLQPREIAAGASLVGPHRDDLRFHLDGRSAGAFGSRAQQRTVALALRLAEARFLRVRAGEAPVLLLDDILSELDERRRGAVLAAVADAEQALITTADLDRFGDAFLNRAAVFGVADGVVRPRAPADP